MLMSSFSMNNTFTGAGTGAALGGPWGAAIGGAVGLASDIGSAVFSHNSAKTQFKRQKDLMKLQNDYNVANWNKQNEYNLPINQRKRLKAAGLNPDLIYGNGANGIVSQPIDGVSQGSASMANTPTFGGALSGALAVANAQSQIELNKSLAHQADSNANKTNAEIPWIDRFNEESVKNLASQTGLNNANASLISENIKLAGQQYSLNDLNIEIERAKAKVAPEYYDTLVKDLKQRYKIDTEQAKIIAKYGMKAMEAQIQLDYAQAYNAYHQGDAATVNAAANMKNANTNAYDATTRRYQYELDKAYQDGDTAISKMTIGNSRVDNNYKLRMVKVTEDIKESQIFSNYTSSVSGAIQHGAQSYKDYKFGKGKK